MGRITVICLRGTMTKAIEDLGRKVLSNEVMLKRAKFSF